MRALLTSVFCTSTTTPAEASTARKLFNREDGFEERAAAAAVLLGNFDAHQSKLEELVDQRGLEHALLVHLLNMRPDGFVGELANGIAKQDFIFGERNQRSWWHIGGGYVRHRMRPQIWVTKPSILALGGTFGAGLHPGFIVTYITL